MLKDNQVTPPLVSVVIPCFNDGKYLNEALQSVLSQSYSRLEVIVVNDGSTDKRTNEILKNASWPRTVILNEENRGPAAARNTGINIAKGKYILPLDADDKIHPSYIDKAVTILEGQEKVGIVYCMANYFGNVKRQWDLPPYSFERMLLDNIIFATALFRKEDWLTVGGYDEELVHGMEDYDFWLSLIELGRNIVQLPEVLFFYRIKESSRTRRFMSDKKQVLETYEKIYRNHPRLYSEHQNLYAIVLRNALIDQIFWAQPYDNLIRRKAIKNSIEIFLLLYNLIRRQFQAIRARLNDIFGRSS